MKLEFALNFIAVCLWMFLAFLILYLFAYKLPKEIGKTEGINPFCFHHWIDPENTISGKWICITFNNDNRYVDGKENKNYMGELK